MCDEITGKYKDYAMFKMSVQPPLKPESYMSSKYTIDDETRHRLNLLEKQRFCVLQLGWFTICVLLTSLFEVLIFILGFFGSDYLSYLDRDSLYYEMFAPFKFTCVPDQSSHWYVDSSPASMMLFKFHFIVIFMYTMTFTIVLWEIPYRFNRLMKTDKELSAEKKKRKKKRTKKRGQKGAGRFSNLID